MEEATEAQPITESEQKVDVQDEQPEAKDVELPSENVPVESAEKTAMEGEEQVDAETEQQLSDSGSKSTSRKIEIPNNKVGVLIGKSGDTIRFLQLNSGAKIQITRDADADQHAATRPVELVGTLESLNKAERLIRDVIAEADAGGSPSLVARGFTAAITAGSLEIEMPVPGDKVGLIIGKGGETIRNLQTRSGARIQLIPQNQPGEQAKEKKVKVTGDKKQVDMARELIMEVMNQIWPFKSGQHSFLGVSVGNHNPVSSTEESCLGDHHNSLAVTMANRATALGYLVVVCLNGEPVVLILLRQCHMTIISEGLTLLKISSTPPQPYGNYPPQGPPRSGFGSWEHRPPTQGPPSHSGGYDYYGQGGGHVGNAPVSAPHSSHMPGHHASGPSMAPHSQANYNYAQPRGPDYAHPTPYSQNAPPVQSYGHGYGEPKYDTQAPMQQQQQPPYAGQGYPPQQQGYAPQQQYNRPPPYGMPPSQGAPPQGYAPPAASQPAADTAYQTPASAAQPYGQNMPPQQQYPQAQYGSAPVTNDGYNQPQPAAAGYPQQAGQPVPAYGQQPTGYAQSAGSTAGYGQYPTTAQASYDPAAAANAAAYGYQGQVDPAAYAAAAGQQVYSATPAVAQQGYAQPGPAQPGYDQTAVAPQSGGYAGAPAGAPAPYGKTLSPQPQPGYPQYDASQQVYAAPR
ncbi:Far upstream element-binding protein 3 [Bienertia sinuspersici]